MKKTITTFSLSKKWSAEVRKFLKHHSDEEITLTLLLAESKIHLQTVATTNGKASTKVEITMKLVPSAIEKPSPFYFSRFSGITHVTVNSTHLCNVLSHLSQFGSTVDFTVENFTTLSLLVGGISAVVECELQTPRPGAVGKLLNIYRFIDVLLLGTRCATDCALFCGTEIPGAVVQFSGSQLTLQFLLKEGKKKT